MAYELNSGNKTITLDQIQNSMVLPAIKYRSGNRVWLTMTIDYQSLSKFVKTTGVRKKNQEIIKTEILNRFLDPKHKNDIKQYLREEKNYTIPPITLVSFEPLSFIPLDGSYSSEDQELLLDRNGAIVGMVQLPLHYEFLCLDGNHRVAAIRELANEDPQLIFRSHMLVNVVVESDERKIRQDFVDVNKNAKQTTQSINTLFNTRDPIARLVADIIEEFEWLKETTELLATSVSKNSKDIYTISNIKRAIIELAGYKSGSSASGDKLSRVLSDSEQYFDELKLNAITFFNRLTENKYIRLCILNRSSIPKIRQEAVITSGVGLIVAANVAHKIFETYNSDENAIYENLQLLFDFDWSRNNTFWKGKLMSENDTILNSITSISETSQALYSEFNLVNN